MFLVTIYEIDKRNKSYKIQKDFGKAFDTYRDAVTYASNYMLQTETFIRGYLINEVLT